MENKTVEIVLQSEHKKQNVTVNKADQLTVLFDEFRKVNETGCNRI